MSERRPARTPESLAQLFADVFETDARGREILEHLELVFAKPPVTTGGIDAILQTYERGGQRLLLDYIHTKIERAHQSAEPADTPQLKTE